MAGQQLLVTNTLGGYFTTPRFSKELFEATKPLYRFRQFADFKEAWGKNAGDTVLFDRFNHMTATDASLNETSTIPRDSVPISQGTLTVSEYGRGIGKTRKLETLSQFNIDDPLHRALRNHMAKSIDKACADQFKDSLGRYVCITGTSGTLTTNGTFGGTATSNLNLFHIKEITDQLQKWNVEPWDDGNYICIASIEALRGIKDDTSTGAWVDANRYAGSKRLFNGEVGELMGVRFIPDTAVMSNAVGSSSAYGEAMIFGRTTVMEGVAIPEEIRVDTPRDFGRDMAVAWYWLGGFKLIWAGSGETLDISAGYVPHVMYVGSA